MMLLKSTSHSIHIFLLSISLLLGACTSTTHQILGRWESADDETAIRSKEITFNHQHGMFWYLSDSDSIRYRYDLYKKQLITMNRHGIFTYRVLKLSKKQLIIQNEEEETQVLSFLLKERLPPPPKQKRNQPHIPVEKDIYDLLFALTGPTVEVRLKNLLAEFQEGDYVTTRTLHYLTGVAPLKQEDELPDAAIHRILLKKIKKIERKGDQFRVELAHHQDIEASLPIYKKKGEQRILQTMLDVKIKSNAVINVHQTERNIRIDIDGVRIGKGWLKLGIPTLTINGSYGRLLGFRFYLAR